MAILADSPSRESATSYISRHDSGFCPMSADLSLFLCADLDLDLDMDVDFDHHCARKASRLLLSTIKSHQQCGEYRNSGSTSTSGSRSTSRSSPGQFAQKRKGIAGGLYRPLLGGQADPSRGKGLGSPWQINAAQKKGSGYRCLKSS